MLKVVQTGIQGLIEIHPSVFPDDRGWFMESFKRSSLRQVGVDTDFLQDNVSFSKKDVLRGLHFQKPPYAQAKLVWVLHGSVRDVVVDLRKNSPTFGKSFKVILSAERKNMLFVPEGFAHGFHALEDSLFQYKCSTEYQPGSEGGLLWKDPSLKINWGVTEPLISSKDAVLPTLSELIEQGIITP